MSEPSKLARRESLAELTSEVALNGRFTTRQNPGNSNQRASVTPVIEGRCGEEPARYDERGAGDIRDVLMPSGERGLASTRKRPSW